MNAINKVAQSGWRVSVENAKWSIVCCVWLVHHNVLDRNEQPGQRTAEQRAAKRMATFPRRASRNGSCERVCVVEILERSAPMIEASKQQIANWWWKSEMQTQMAADFTRMRTFDQP